MTRLAGTVALAAMLLAAYVPLPNVATKAQLPVTVPIDTPEDPVVGEIRQLMDERGSSLAEVAAAMRSHLELPAVVGSLDSGGCHGLAWTAEHDAPERAEPGVVSQHSVDAIVDDLIQSGPTELARALVALRAGGGGLELADAGQLPDGTIALLVGDDLIVSVDWVHAATLDPTSIHANLAHELAHMHYETPITCVILESALANSAILSDFDQYRATYLTYIYPEAEIYAELHELSYHSESALGDDPYVDIIVQVQKIQDAFPPEIAALVFDWIRLGCTTDRTMSIDARFYCHAAVPRGVQ